MFLGLSTWEKFQIKITKLSFFLSPSFSGRVEFCTFLHPTIFIFFNLFQMTDNPWNVDSVHAFYFLKCPECIFESQEEYTFRDHAIENHPRILNSIFK